MAKKPINKNEKEDKEISKSYNPSPEVKKRIKALQDRIRVLEERKKQLGINEKCDRMDRLFTPHLVNLIGSGNTEEDQYYTNFEFEEKRLLATAEEKRKSKPLAFEKITTALASLIKEIPKAKAKPFKEKYRKLNKMVEATYYENWEANRSIKQLKRFTYHLAKYGIAYGRRYYKRVWKKVREPIGKDENGKIKYDERWDYKVNDVVWECINPRWVLLDDSAIGPDDANDVAFIDYVDEKTFKSRFPAEVFPDARFVKQGSAREIIVDATGNHRIKTKTLTGDLKDKIQITYYQNELDDSEEIVANGVYLEEHPLPGHRLSIFGAKWIEDKEDYDGIGIGQIIEIYQPIVDDIINASNERLRQLVRPVRVMGNDVKIANDEDFVWQSGSEMRVEGDVNQVKWDRPPVTSSAELEERQMLEEEIDVATFVPKALGGLDVSDTAYQAAQNREAALKKLSLPLDNIKDALEDDANIAFRLFQQVYSQPIKTDILIPETPEFTEAQQYLMMVQSGQIADDGRFVRMEDGSIARRQFREMELPLTKEMKKEGENMIDTGNVIESEEREFWEMIPEHFNWEGYINIEPMSFLPVSEALEVQQKKDRATFLLAIPDTDEMGNPTLKDENGQPYNINRVQAIKDYVESTNADATRYIIPMANPQQLQGNINPLNNPDSITPKEAVGNSRPETNTETPVTNSIKPV